MLKLSLISSKCIKNIVWIIPRHNKLWYDQQQAKIIRTSYYLHYVYINCIKLELIKKKQILNIQVPLVRNGEKTFITQYVTKAMYFKKKYETSFSGENLCAHSKKSRNKVLKCIL